MGYVSLPEGIFLLTCEKPGGEKMSRISPRVPDFLQGGPVSSR